MAATDLFQFSSMDLIRLRKWYQKAPQQFAAATGRLLNNFAFGSRLEALGIIHTRMIVRSPGFVRSRVQVKKSHFRMPVESQVSMFGSVRDKEGRFTGWVAQEYGTRRIREYFAALAGRGRSKRRVIKRGARLNKPYITPDRFPKRRGFKGRNRDHLIQIMLKRLDEMNYSKPFVITGHSRIPGGLYEFGQDRTGWDQRKLVALQLFYQPKPTKRVRWMSGGTKRYFSGINLRREWGKVVKRTVDRKLR